ncbi:DNA internalization-related competence protein ComEC/Rec2 [Companilactobacillus furfuricola]|uniref:DNA internalization-related competence protein ComEC/Rec2 n=1 Tax=Companilactobacillus furfuricola TaxID=1462575 RepID=UPI000F79052E|nr:DNA internalization-related competence protein ComEC/Rec2 [Companilactobacillus furfuricola]
MRDKLVFFAIIASGMSFLIFTQHIFLSSLILLAFFIRIYYLKNLPMMIGTIVIAICFGSFFFIAEQKIEHPEVSRSLKTASIYPDEIHVEGDSLSGQLISNGKRYQFFSRIKDQRTQKFWQNLEHPIDCQIGNGGIDFVRGPRNPGEFDFKRYLNHRGIFEMVKAKDIKSITRHRASNIADQIHLAKIDFLNYLGHLPKWLKIHAQGLLVGYTSQDARLLYQTLSVLGVIHLFSLSGLHVFILITVLYKMSSFLRIPKEWIDWLLLGILPLYGAFVGLKTGISRAIVLALLVIIFNKLKIKITGLDLFSITVMICLLLDPFCLIEMGGQLSFVLSGALLFLKSTKLILTTVKMNLLSLPIIVFNAFQLNLLIILMNLIFVPIFNYLIIPTVVVSTLFLNYFPGMWQIINQVFDSMYNILDGLAKMSQLNVIVGKFPVISILLLVYLALFNIEHPKLLNSYFYKYLLIFAVSLVFVKVPLFGSVSIIDVGQGDSILVTTPLIRKVILIDTGGMLTFPKQPWQKKKIVTQVEKSTIPYLKSLGVSQIDQVFLSHKDSDHIGNIETLLAKFPVAQVNFGIGLEQNKQISDLVKDNPHTIFTHLKQGDNFSTWPINWQVLWPKKVSIGENQDSLTLLAHIGQTNWLFTGDLDQSSEKKILQDHSFKVDMLKAGHHGSKTSTSNELLDKTKPDLALISAGINNRYGHPNKETIQRLDDHRIPHLNTADYGMITWYYFPFSNYQKLETFLR